MKRREFVTLLGSAVATWPLGARAQQTATPIIGFLHSGSAQQNAKRLTAYRKGLKEAGFIEGQNVAIEFRWAAGQNDKLPALAADLIQRQVAVIATPRQHACRGCSQSRDLDHPDRLCRGRRPRRAWSRDQPQSPGWQRHRNHLNECRHCRKAFRADTRTSAASHFLFRIGQSCFAFGAADDQGAATLGIALEILRARSDAEIDAVMGRLQSTADVMVSGTDALFFVRRAHIAALALRQALPTIFDDREYATAGALASYGADFLNVMELAGDYTGRVLKGQKPADLPAVQAAKFEFVINRKTTTALGIRIPPTLLALADEVIE